MQQHVTVVRAIGAEYIRRTIKPVLIIGGIILSILFAIGIWLVTQSLWWLILQFFISIVCLFFIIATTVIVYIIKFADTVRNDEQKQAISQYVDTLEQVAEHMQTPQFIIVFKIVRDIMRPRKNGFIKSLSAGTKSLAPDYQRLLSLF